MSEIVLMMGYIVIVDVTVNFRRVLKALARCNNNEELAEDIIKIVTGDETHEGDRASLIILEPKKPAVPATLNSSINPLSNNAYKSTVSSFTNRLFLDALVTIHRYEEYFHVGFEFVASYNAFHFAKSVLRHMELVAIPKLRMHVDKLYAAASAHLADAIQLSNKATEAAITSMNLNEAVVGGGGGGAAGSIGMVGQTMTGGTKSLREGLSVVVRVATILAQSVELKGVLDKEGIETVARCVGGLNTMLG
jgi:hypothetical protein